MTTLVTNITDFRARFLAYSITPNDARVQVFLDYAPDYISADDYGFLNGDSRLSALYLMAAHLLAIDDNVAAGVAAGIITSASEGSESIGIAPPPTKNMFQYWLAQTPYGQQLLALLKLKSVGGMYVHGSFAATGNIRKPTGRFY
jgi:hypothetical protein